MKSGTALRPQAAVLANAAAAWLAAAWPWPGPTPDNPHSRRVALLKRLLPTIGLFLLLLIAIWPQMAPLWQRIRLALPAIDLREAKELRMLNPRYAGTDRLGRPYVVTAAIGRQAPDRQDLMSLEKPRADIKVHGDAELVVTAATGIYQSQAQLLDLFGEVTLVHQDGTRFVTESARVNVASNSADGSDPVTGHGPSGDVTSAGFQIINKGAAIIFTGKSDMLLRGAAKSAAAPSRQPAALPAPVSVAAKEAEVAAKPLLAAAKPAPAKAVAQPAGRQSPKPNPQAKPASASALPAKPSPAKPASATATAKPAAAKPAPDKTVQKSASNVPAQ